MVTSRSYSYDETYAAMCLWEEIVSSSLPDAPHPWEAHRDQWGAAWLREEVLNRLAGACDRAWNRVLAQYDEALERHHEMAPARDTPLTGAGGDRWRAHEDVRPQAPGDFDWEFVPVWLRECVDWSDVDEGPRVRYDP